ncbi:MAG TPA: M50 family metallopeptidase [Kofleriaceae bacterium]|nr:M50 family metallopeptidase [Kofleriaceae bacterium]
MAIGLAAAIVFIIDAWMPFGSTILYPLTLFTTWVHEMGHGLAALLQGGEFTEIVINKNAGGYAMAFASRGWGQAIVCAGGMLAPPLLGSAIIATVHGPRRARIVLAALAIAIVVSLLIYVRSATGVIALPFVAALLGWSATLGFRKNPHRRVVMAQVLGVLLAVDTVTRMVGYALSTEARKGEASDVQLMANEVGGPYWLYGLAIIAIALSALALSLWWAWRRPAAPAAVDRSPARRASKAAR